MSDGNSWWRRVTRNCCSRLRVDEKDNVVSSTEHNRETESERNVSKKVVSKIHDKDVEKPGQIIPQTSAHIASNGVEPTKRNMILIDRRLMDKFKESKIISKSDIELHDILYKNIVDGVKN